MGLKFVVNPRLEADAVSALRKAVGWDSRKDQLKKTLGCTYLSGACFDQSSLVGFVDVISDGVDDALIRNLIVHPEYQGQGIAQNLLKLVIEKIRADQIKTINVLFEPEHTELYREAGFKIISGGIIDNEAEEFF